MASASYIAKRREISRKRSALGVAARRRKMLERSKEMRVVATVKTSGSLGAHTVELLACSDMAGGGACPTVYVRFDGELRCPRTANGFVKLLGRWLWTRAE